MESENRVGEEASGRAGETAAHGCAHCGACEKHDRCDHCGYCRKCGVYVMLPAQIAPIIWPSPYNPWPPYMTTFAGMATRGESPLSVTGNTYTATGGEQISFSNRTLSSGAGEIGSN